MTAVGAVVIGTAALDRAEHRVEGLGAVGNELRLMPGPAVDPLAAMAGVGCKQLLEQTCAQLGHRAVRIASANAANPAPLPAISELAASSVSWPTSVASSA